jgi:ArsR family transcriptional regulator
MTPVELFKALGDHIRLTSLLLIEQEGELCVCELTCALDESQPKVSRHLALLRRSGVLADRRAGQWVFYSLDPQMSPWIHRVLKETAKANADYLAESLARLHTMKERPGRNLCASNS